MNINIDFTHSSRKIFHKDIVIDIYASDIFCSIHDKTRRDKTKHGITLCEPDKIRRMYIEFVNYCIFVNWWNLHFFTVLSYCMHTENATWPKTQWYWYRFLYLEHIYSLLLGRDIRWFKARSYLFLMQEFNILYKDKKCQIIAANYLKQTIKYVLPYKPLNWVHPSPWQVKMYFS